MKTKKEFLKEYGETHPEYKLYIAFQMIFDILGGIMLIFGMIKWKDAYRDSEKQLYMFIAIIGGILLIVGFIFLKLLQNHSSRSMVEWEKYSAAQKRESSFSDVSDSLFQDEKTAKTGSKWECSKCKALNSSVLSKCLSCGADRDSSAVLIKQQKNNRTPNANEWVCAVCGRINQNYVGTCGCGNTKPR